ncbi:hypothetical protein C8F04DRAFT_1121532 [Mycena alexandri]|uniref:Secreted protein n=1 Tax=Mycena alexandri TaxID=1745969 RepID=A0AAD6SHQ3_9AGAR|nr:hypothetical protein C8F04DRAFT_1121532 [Mycena alexandri]
MRRRRAGIVFMLLLMLAPPPNAGPPHSSQLTSTSPSPPRQARGPKEGMSAGKRLCGCGRRSWRRWGRRDCGWGGRGDPFTAPYTSVATLFVGALPSAPLPSLGGESGRDAF